MEISPEALDLLRTATVPFEFKAVVREVVPNIGMSSPTELEGTPASSMVDMTSIETQKVPIQPVEIPVASVPVSWPEMATSDRGVQVFYLTDLTLDLSGVAHMTPGLHELALSTLLPIVSNLPAFWGMDQLYFFNQDGPSPDGEEGEDEDVTEPPKTCDAEFVSGRRDRDWYRNNGFGEKRVCPQTRTITVSETKSIPIYWTIAGVQWTEAEAREKLDTAKRWFDRYCISLDIKDVQLQPDESNRFSAALSRADRQGKAQYRSQVCEVYKHLWKNRMGQPKTFLLLLFVDQFNEIIYWQRIDRISGNFADIPVILITSADKTSRHIVTHELIHGLGKGIRRGSPPTSVPWAGDSRDNTWSEGGCGEEMGNAARSDPSDPMTKSDTAPMDWASYYQYRELSKSIRPTS